MGDAVVVVVESVGGCGGGGGALVGVAVQGIQAELPQLDGYLRRKVPTYLPTRPAP